MLMVHGRCCAVDPEAKRKLLGIHSGRTSCTDHESYKHLGDKGACQLWRCRSRRQGGPEVSDKMALIRIARATRTELKASMPA